MDNTRQIKINACKRSVAAQYVIAFARRNRLPVQITYGLASDRFGEEVTVTDPEGPHTYPGFDLAMGFLRGYARKQAASANGG